MLRRGTTGQYVGGRRGHSSNGRGERADACAMSVTDGPGPAFMAPTAAAWASTSPAEPSTPPGHHELGNPKFGAPPLSIGTTFRDDLDGSFQLKLGISYARRRVTDRDAVVGHGNCPQSADGQATTLHLSGGPGRLCSRRARNATLWRINPFLLYR